MEDTGIYLEDRPFYNVAEVSELFSVTERTVRRWIDEGLISTYKPRRRHLISTESIRELIVSGENCIDHEKIARNSTKS